jgi:hypothetical protein
MKVIATHFPSGHDDRPGGFIRLVLNLIDGFREARQMRNRYEQLAHKSGAELVSLKLRRQDLPRIALGGRP